MKQKNDYIMRLDWKVGQPKNASTKYVLRRLICEVHGVSVDGSTRRIDMIAFQDTNKGWFIDPTIRMESHADQPIEVHNEKCSIYNATISYYKNKYQLKDIVVLGLMVGARGTITSQFCRQFNLDKNFIKEIAVINRQVHWCCSGQEIKIANKSRPGGLLVARNTAAAIESLRNVQPQSVGVSNQL
ncbi:hypothetical protein C0J52_03914 [Blattella germanica]|nr:hypothetical protein C0J52_03914 [Blattella germanica]